MKIKSIVKQILKPICFSLLVILLFFPLSFIVRTSESLAQGGTFYGGMRTSMMTCTCSGNILIFIQNYATNSVLRLIYDGSGRLYSNNNIFGTYLLGSYSSGGECKMIAYPECTVIPSDGKFDSSPGTGTS